MKALKILLFIALLPLSIFLFDLLFMYTYSMSQSLNLWGKIFFFFPVLGLSYYIPVKITGFITLLNPYRWLSIILIIPFFIIWVGYNIYELWTMPIDYGSIVIFRSTYFTLLLIIILVAGIYAPFELENTD